MIITIITFIILIVGLNCIPLLIKKDYPKTKGIIIKSLFIITFLLLTILIFNLYGYRPKGKFTLKIIGLIFILLTFTYFATQKNTIQKILTSAFIVTPILVMFIFTYIFLFTQTLKEFKIDDNTKIITTEGRFLSCGELIYITQNKFLIFDKEVHYESSLCLRGIEKIETVKIDDKNVEFFIYHNGEMDSENPYKYNVERKNCW